MSFFSRLLQAIPLALPFECAICHQWPSAAYAGVTGVTGVTGVAGVCNNCIESHAKAPPFPVPQGLDDCIAAVNFDTPWSALIARYKFAPEPGLARLFAGLMLRETGIRELIASADIVMPLPLSAERLEERGFNQALALAKHLVKHSAKHKIAPTALIRTRNTAPQRLLDREARARNVANAFALQANTDVALKGKRVLLIDDVTTTGATLVAAAAPLYKAGAAHVSAVVIARTPLV
ncbi:MAG: phosphoribosyltransferase family protein [Cytophagales bacterium]|nr:phosphoribosyltransferase family protein [Cytophagales bacterium]